MNMTVDGNNSFHTGWLARFLDLPRVLPGGEAVKAESLVAFRDGWDTCDHTPAEDRYYVFLAMKSAKQAHAGWVDDDGEDVVLENR